MEQSNTEYLAEKRNSPTWVAHVEKARADWASQICDEQGNLIPELVYAELGDFSLLADTFSKVVSHATNDRMSGISLGGSIYTWESIRICMDEVRSDKINDALEDARDVTE